MERMNTREQEQYDERHQYAIQTALKAVQDAAMQAPWNPDKSDDTARALVAMQEFITGHFAARRALREYAGMYPHGTDKAGTGQRILYALFFLNVMIGIFFFSAQDWHKQSVQAIDAAVQAVASDPNCQWAVKALEESRTRTGK